MVNQLSGAVGFESFLTSHLGAVTVVGGERPGINRSVDPTVHRPVLRNQWSGG